MKGEKIVITGGPSTGKTSVIESLKSRGYTCIDELVRGMTMTEKDDDIEFVTNPILSVKDPIAFNNKLLKGRIAQYNSVEKTSKEIVFFDRGIPDVHSYMNCFGQSYNDDFERPAYEFRYDRILLMPPWLDIYATDPERFESYEESLRISSSLEQTYKHFGYNIITIPKASIVERTDFILNLVNSD